METNALYASPTSSLQTGREAYIIDPVKSLVAEKIGMKSKGEYAIKVR